MFNNYQGKLLIRDLSASEVAFLEELDASDTYLGIEALRLETGEIIFHAWCERDADGGGNYLCLYIYTDVVLEADLTILTERARRCARQIESDYADVAGNDPGEHLVGIATANIEGDLPRTVAGLDLEIWKLGDTTGWGSDDSE